MLNISYVVVGDHRRLDRATSLANDLCASLALDKDGRWGPGVNHMRAWILGNTTKCDWICVLEDDAVLCTEFLKHAEEALRNAPSPLVSFYLGTNYPSNKAARAEAEVSAAVEAERDWITLPSLNHGVCIALRQEHVNSMIEYATKSKRPIDEAINEWSQMRRIKTSYPTYSLVDHLDEDILITNSQRSDRQERLLPRRAIKFRG